MTEQLSYKAQLFDHAIFQILLVSYVHVELYAHNSLLYLEQTFHIGSFT